MSSLTLISLDYRDQFMKKNSFEYEGIKWSNVQIPSEVVIISELRSNAFFNNQVIPLENKLNLQKGTYEKTNLHHYDHFILFIQKILPK